ncbi:GNAT family N-acetyltransferase [Sediminimonas sp.]|uniref:GNAT family N-acetyltransferase n=1 Tax=Sediminimonas sp. TaxID=2823379 RepID=UPI0025F2735D|nr:GNAT family N-acetyltransferase [Sediminimonas sp.]
MRLEISPVTPGDRPDWQDLWTDYLAFYETSVPAEVYDTTFHRLCADDVPRQNGLIARQDGQAVGLVHYIYHPHNWKIEDVCYLQDLYAAPGIRGTGVGRALIEAVYDAADRNGTPSVYWLTQDFNSRARRLYDRIGVLTPFIKYARG